MQSNASAADSANSKHAMYSNSSSGLQMFSSAAQNGIYDKFEMRFAWIACSSHMLRDSSITSDERGCACGHLAVQRHGCGGPALGDASLQADAQQHDETRKERNSKMQDAAPASTKTYGDA